MKDRRPEIHKGDEVFRMEGAAGWGRKKTWSLSELRNRTGGSG